MLTMNVIDVDIHKLIFYENNPRDNDGAIEVVKNSIERFGFKVPVMVDSNNVIICGHTRVKAGLELGMETVPCIVEDNMTEEEVKAFRLVENKTHELSFWDKSLLDFELEQLEDSFDMEDFGFESDISAINDNVDDFFKEVEQTSGQTITETDHSGEVECPNCKFRFKP